MPTLPTSTKSSYASAAQPGGCGGGVRTPQLPPTGVSEVDSKGRGGRQAEGQGPTTPLWKGFSASSGGRPAGTGKWEGANARSRPRLGKGVPSLSFYPLPPAELHRAPRGKAQRTCVAGTGAWTQSPCQPWSLSSGLPRAPSPSVTQKREGPHPWRGSPTEGIDTGRQREARPDIRGHAAQDPSRDASLVLRPAPYRFSPGWYWGSVDVK